MKGRKYPRIGLALIVLGLGSYAAEKLFYGDLDANGILQESFFLPLAFLLAICGLLICLVGFLLRR
jgi:hypothetical protein